MKGIVLIPCWQRPEWLSICLERIEAARGWQDYHYLLLPDRKACADTLAICEAWQAPSKAVRINERHSYHGNSHNLLTGYMLALEWLITNNGGLCHMIEDDIWISGGYFEFHEKAWEIDPSAFYVTACRNQMADDQEGSAADVYRFPWYQSLGVSMRMSSLAMLRPHVNHAYFRNMGSYCQKFLPTGLGGGCSEQDGLMCRIIQRENLHGIYPCVPRAYHAGFMGYNRPAKRLDGSLQLADRITQLRAMTEDEMNQRASNPSHKDIRQCEMGYFEPQTLNLVPC